MITTVTLNPALDKILQLNSLKVGELNPVEKSLEKAGGKGINVARIVHKLNREVLAISLMGGYTGEVLQRIIKEEGIPSSIIDIQEKTRENIKIVEKSGSETEINQKGCLDIKDYHKFLENFKNEIKKTDLLVLSGSLPQGLPSDTYCQLIELAQKENLKTILDTSGQALEIAINSKPYLIKPNIAELRSLFKLELRKISDIITAAKSIIAKGVNTVVISLGAKGALYIQKNCYYHLRPPLLKIAETTVGAGDSMVAGLAIAISENMSLKEMSKYSTALASLFVSGGPIDEENIDLMKDKLRVIDEVAVDEIV
ncbi:MAG: 1-phosphofructokinase [bacterium]